MLDKQLRDKLEADRGDTEKIAQTLIEQVCANKEIVYDTGDLIISRDKFNKFTDWNIADTAVTDF